MTRLAWNKGIPRTIETKKKISERTKGRIPWNKGLTKERDKRVLKYSQTLSANRQGKNNPNYGCGLRPKKQVLITLYIDKKQSRKQVATTFNVAKNTVDKWLQFYRILLPREEQQRRRLQGRRTPEARQKASQTMKKVVEEKRSVYLNNLFYSSKPTSIEVKFMDICTKNNFPLQYVGNGECWIGRKNPDFINFDHKLLVEVLGEYWHTPKEAERRKEFFALHGYQTLLIWQKEFKHIDLIIKKTRKWLIVNGIIL